MKSDATVTVRRQLIKMLFLWLFLLCGGLVAVVVLSDVIVSTHILSTKDAPGFSEAKFSSITTGMTPAQVRSVLGEPLRIGHGPESRRELWYTEPKEPIEGWGTWDARYFVVSNEIVTEIYRHSVMNH